MNRHPCLTRMNVAEILECQIDFNAILSFHRIDFSLIFVIREVQFCGRVALYAHSQNTSYRNSTCSSTN